MLPLTALLFHFDSETISGVGGLCFEGDDYKRFINFFEEKSAHDDMA